MREGHAEHWAVLVSRIGLCRACEAPEELTLGLWWRGGSWWAGQACGSALWGLGEEIIWANLGARAERKS